MRLFKKRTQNKSDGTTSKDKVAKSIVGLILKIQNGFAKFMSKRTEKIPTSFMKIGLIIFLLAGSSLSIYFITEALLKKEKSNLLRVDRLRVPKYYNKSGDESIQPDFFISEQEHAEMQAFQKYMDSLYRSDDGKRIYDSITLHRPGLLDSVNMLERFYQSQIKNKK